jgi:hypothetical protein
MKNGVFWDVTPTFQKNVSLVTANIALGSLILSALMLEATSSSDTSVLTRAYHSPENGILHRKRS